MSAVKKIVSGSFWTIINTIIGAIYSFAAVPLLINHFGNANYGLIGLATSLNVYMNLADMGLNTTNVRFFSIWLLKKDYEKVDKLFSTNLAIYGSMGIVNSIVMLLIYYCSSALFNVDESQDQTLKHLLLILATSSFVCWFTSCFEQIIRATENVGWFQKIAVIPRLLLIVILILTISCDLSIEVYFMGTMFVGFVVLPVHIKKIKSEIPNISFKIKFNKRIFKEILPYSLNIFSFGIFQFCFHNLRPVFLGMQGTLESITDYRIINGIVGLVAMIGTMFGSVLMPTASRVVASDDNVRFNLIAYKGTKYLTFFLSLLVFALITVGNDLILLYVGKDFENLTFWLYVWAIITLGNHNQFISSLMLSFPDLRQLAYMTAFSSILGLIGCWILIPYFQVGGAILSLGLYSMLQLAFYYFYYYPSFLHLDSLKLLLKNVLPSVILGCLISIICINLPHTNIYIANILIFGILFLLLYLSASFLIFNKEDLAFFLKYLRKDE